MDAIIIPVLGIMVPIVIVPTVLGIRHARQVRELEHKERMKALELGRSLPGDEPWSSPARISLAIAAGVPIGVFFCAWMATQATGFKQDIWMTSMVTSMTAVISGSILAGKHFTQRAAAEAAAQAAYGKPEMHDADAFDVVGSRG
jgi:hypothetical protein